MTYTDKQRLERARAAMREAYIVLNTSDPEQEHPMVQNAMKRLEKASFGLAAMLGGKP